MSDDHEVLISTAHVAATCRCGWTSEAVGDYATKRDQADAHMYEHYAVFVDAGELDGTRTLCWGTK